MINKKNNTIFSGNIFILHSFDVGEDVDLEKITNSNILVSKPVALSKYFKNYHRPISVELPTPENSPNLVSTKIHNFGVLILRYQIPFSSTLEDLKGHINEIYDKCHDKSVEDAKTIFEKIQPFVNQPKFFYLRDSYVLVQVNTIPEKSDVVQFKNEYGNLITSIVRFETETLSDYQRNEILSDAIGYYSGDLIVIDTEAAFAYDDEYENKLDLFEFATIQYLELQYFDRLLDKKLNIVYESRLKDIPLKAYFLPFTSKALMPPLRELGQLKADISVIIDRLENSVKLAGDAYYSELYSLIVTKLDLKSWRESVQSKFSIIHDISSFYQSRIESSRQDFFSIVIIILISIELAMVFFK